MAIPGYHYACQICYACTGFHSNINNSCRQLQVEYVYWFPALEFVLDHYVSVGFMVNIHPTVRAEPRDKDGYCKSQTNIHYSPT